MYIKKMDANIGFFFLEWMMFKLPLMKAGGFAGHQMEDQRDTKKAKTKHN